MDGSVRLLLVRHCQAAGQSPDAPLTAAGVRQAERLRDFLIDEAIDLVLSSDFVRAYYSAEPLAASRGLPVRSDARLNERILSDKPLPNWREILRNSFVDHDLCGPGGESASEALDRAQSVIKEIVRTGYETPVVVTHGNLMSLVLHSIDGSFGYEGWENLSNPDVYVLEITGNGSATFRRIWK